MQRLISESGPELWMWVYQADGAFTVRRFIVVLFFPFIVYFIYITYGGAKSAYDAVKKAAFE